MKVTVKLFATLGDYLPEAARRTNSLELEVPAGISVGELVSRFNLPERLVHLVLVNGNYIPAEERLSHALADGDQLAVWPPVAGG
jgi:molybdopterin converting factor small subunit